MFEEVGETVLIRSFLNGTYIGSQVEFGSLGRFVIVPDIVCQAVFQLAFPDSRIIRQPAGSFGSCVGAGICAKTAAAENSRAAKRKIFFIIYG